MLAFAHTALTWIVPFLFVLTLIVTVHELGHFLVARAFGVAVESFSIGFGRAVLSWRDRAGVNWRLGWLPLGGYVRFAGDENAASLPDAQALADLRAEIIAAEGPDAVGKYFHFKPIWQRALVVAAGPIANFVLAAALFAALLMTVGQSTPATQQPQQPARVDAVTPGSAAAVAGFQTGDMILRAGGRAIHSFNDLQQVIAPKPGVAIVFTVHRGARMIDLTATPAKALTQDASGKTVVVGRLGIASNAKSVDGPRRRLAPLEALGRGVAMTWEVLRLTVATLADIVRGHVAASNLSGPLGIAQATHAVAEAGADGAHGLGGQILGALVSLLGFSAVISVGIGFMNLLPVPILDGGHLLFYAYEAVARRPLDAAIQTASYRVGLALLLGLMLFATTNDLQRSSVSHFLGGLFSR